MTNIKDLSMGFDKDMADSTTRGTGGFKTERGTLIATGLTFDMLYDDADADVAAFSTCYFSTPGSTSRVVALACLSGGTATSGVEGLWADFEVKKFDIKQPLNGLQMVSVEVTPTDNTAVSPLVPPAFVKVT